MAYGTGDDVGSVEIWQRFIDRLPDARLHVVDGGGHMPWMDDGPGVGAEVARLLLGG
jgi:pimeloyl-ACP methyl ester carboxylesterase